MMIVSGPPTLAATGAGADAGVVAEPPTDPSGLSPGARQIDASARETIDLLTPFQTAPKPSRRWWKGGKGLGWAALVFALVFILLLTSLHVYQRRTSRLSHPSPARGA